MIQIIYVQDAGYVVLSNIILYGILAVLAWKYMKNKKANYSDSALVSLNSKIESFEAKLLDTQERIDTISIKVGMSARFINEKADQTKTR
jgi:hypothetical protein